MVGSPDSLRTPGWPSLAYCEPTPTKGTILASPCSRVDAVCAGRRSSRAGDRLRDGLATIGHVGRAGAGCTRDEPARHRSRGAGPGGGRGHREGERDQRDGRHRARSLRGRRRVGGRRRVHPRDRSGRLARPRDREGRRERPRGRGPRCRCCRRPSCRAGSGTGPGPGRGTGRRRRTRPGRLRPVGARGVGRACRHTGVDPPGRPLERARRGDRRRCPECRPGVAAGRDDPVAGPRGRGGQPAAAHRHRLVGADPGGRAASRPSGSGSRAAAGRAHAGRARTAAHPQADARAGGGAQPPQAARPRGGPRSLPDARARTQGAGRRPAGPGAPRSPQRRRGRPARLGRRPCPAGRCGRPPAGRPYARSPRGCRSCCERIRAERQQSIGADPRGPGVRASGRRTAGPTASSSCRHARAGPDRTGGAGRGRTGTPSVHDAAGRDARGVGRCLAADVGPHRCRLDPGLGDHRGDADGGATAGAAAPSPAGRERAMTRVRAVALSTAVLFLAGCSVPLPTPQPDALPAAMPPALSVEQAEDIVAEVSASLADADAALSVDVPGPRVTGPAATIRSFQYLLVTAGLADALTVIPSGAQTLVLPTTDEWPRTVMVVTEPPEDLQAPLLLTLVQTEPRAPYQLWSWVRLFPGVKTPGLAQPELGSAPVEPDAPELAVSPTDVLAQYVDVLTNRDASPYAAAFTADPLRQGIAQTKDAFVAVVGANGTLTETYQPDEAGTSSMATGDR